MHVDGSVAPVEIVDVPEGHAVQIEAPTEDQPPAEHAVHVDALAEGWNVPAVHTEQELDPAAAYCPTPQSVHTSDPRRLYVPEGHWSIHAAVPEAPNVPGGHSMHVDGLVAPVALLTVPARQVVHPEAPKDAHVPAAHIIQADKEVAPVTALAVPAGHAVHTVLSVPPEDVDQVPARHAVHPVDPEVEDQVPAGHAAHPEAPKEEYCPAGHCTHDDALVAPDT